MPFRPFPSLRPFAIPRIALALGVGCLTLACSGGSGSTGPTSGGGNDSTGSLAITISAPSGVTASVDVSGPKGYTHTVTTTQTLSGLAPGSYTIFANAVAGGGDPIVGVPYAGVVTGNPATVSANATATATVAYAKRATEGLLWVANYSSSLVSGFSSSELASSGSPTPAVSVHADGPLAFAIDATGGAWTCPGIGDTLYYYAQSQLLNGGAPKPTVRILAANAIFGITAVAFDGAGDLWVAGQYSNSLIEYTPAQLAAGGSPTPAVTISAVFGSLERPFSMAFDAKGDLWVGSVTDSSIVAYSPSQLRSGGDAVPTYAITNTAGISAPVGLAFDAAGNLWVANDIGLVSEFTATDLQSVGSPKAKVIVTLANNAQPGGIAFDESGDLWVSDFNNNQVVEYTPNQLTATGKPTPAAVIGAHSGSIAQPGVIAFSPHAANLPIH